MALLQDATSLLLMGIAGASLATALLLIFWYGRHERRERLRLERNRTDIADMSILFQTMRDVIKQQKTLAREFNEKLDTKMGMVKGILAQGMERNKALYERQQVLTEQLAEAEAQLDSLQRQAAYARPADAPPAAAETGLSAGDADTGADGATDAGSLHAAFQTRGVTPVAPVSESIAETAPKVGAGAADNFTSWELPDLDAPAPEAAAEEPEEEAEETPAAPEDPQAARQAFRALLDLEPVHPGGDRARPGVPEELTPEIVSSAMGEQAGGDGTEAGQQGNGGDGRDFTATLQKRVLEYSQAGMTVTDISRELGIGKGEVRLMLSLMKQSGP